MLYYVLNTTFVLVCLLLLLVVLLQQGKGGDIASAFGGGGSQTAFGARGSATVLSKATVVLGTLFMLVALTLAIIGRRGPSSILSGVESPGQIQPVAAESEAEPDNPSGTPDSPAGSPVGQQEDATPPAGEAEQAA